MGGREVGTGPQWLLHFCKQSYRRGSALSTSHFSPGSRLVMIAFQRLYLDVC